MEYLLMFIVIGGALSLLCTIINLILHSKNKNAHICASSLIYNYISARIGGAIFYILEGLLLLFLQAQASSIDQYVGSVLTGLDSAVYLYGNLICILILLNIYQAFKNPLQSPTNNFCLMMSSLILSVACGVGIFFLDKYQADSTSQLTNIISFASKWRLYCEILILTITIIASLVLFIKMKVTLSSYKNIRSINSFLGVLAWFVLMFLVINMLCICYVIIPLVYKFKPNSNNLKIFLTLGSFEPMIQMIPFIYTLISLSSGTKSKGAMSLNISKIRYEYVTSILKGISSCFRDKMKPKDKCVLIPLLSDSDHSTDASERLSNKSYSTSINQEELEGHSHSQILSNRIRITEIAPYHFDKIRERYNVSSKEIANLFTIPQYSGGRISAYTKGEIFYIEHRESSLIIKSLSREEYNTLHYSLKYFCNFIEENVDNVLQPILGIYEIKYENAKIEELYVILTLKTSTFKNPYSYKIRPRNNYICNVKHESKSVIDLKKLDCQNLIENRNIKLENFYLPKEIMLTQMQRFENTIEMIKKLESTKYALQFDIKFKNKEIIEGKNIDNYLNHYLTKNEIQNKIFLYRKESIFILKELHASYSIEYHISEATNISQLESILGDKTQALLENLIIYFTSETYSEAPYKEQINGKYALCPFKRVCDQCVKQGSNHVHVTNYTGCTKKKEKDNKQMTQLLIRNSLSLIKVKISMAFTQYFNVY